MAYINAKGRVTVMSGWGGRVWFAGPEGIRDSVWDSLLERGCLKFNEDRVASHRRPDRFLTVSESCRHEYLAEGIEAK